MSEQQEGDSAEATKWGDPISNERAAELVRLLESWGPEEYFEAGQKSPFMYVRLSGADVYWLAQRTRSTASTLDGLHLEGALLDHADLLGADLSGAKLDGVDLREANLSGAMLTDTSLKGAHLARANLRNANLTSADLQGTWLNGANLFGADLTSANLEGASLTRANLLEANLREAWFNSKTILREVEIDSSTSLGDIQWDGVGSVNLTQINWDNVISLGDEFSAGTSGSVWRTQACTRAYRQLAVQLRAQGMSDVADRFAYRGQIWQRKLLFRRFFDDTDETRSPIHYLGKSLLYIIGYRSTAFGQWLFSWLLYLLAGYGYKPWRSVLWYVGAIAGFAALYLHFGVVDTHPFNPVEAAVFSLTSFHGRGFFPGGLKLDDPVTIMAAIEAVIGLFIEISFIATFTQRFFGAR